MTYTTGGLQVYKDLEITSLSWSGTPTLNTYLTFSIEDELPSAFITSLTNTNTEINLPAGNYFSQAYVDFTRTYTSDVFEFKWEVDGSIVGHIGQTDVMNSRSSDVAEAAFELSSAGVLRLKVTGASGSAVTLNSPHCMILIWRTSA